MVVIPARGRPYLRVVVVVVVGDVAVHVRGGRAVRGQL